MFLKIFGFFSVHVLFVCLFSYGLSMMGPDETLSFSMGHSSSKENAAMIALCMWPLATLGSLWFLAMNLRTLRSRGAIEWLRDRWNVMHFVTYATQLLVDCLFILQIVPHPSMCVVCAASILLLFGDTLFFARGFDTIGPIVTMVFEIIIQIRHYMLAMLIIVAGFSMAFTVLLGPKVAMFKNPLASAFWLINTGVYGELTWIVPAVADQDQGCDAGEGETEQHGLSVPAIVLFELFMALVALVWLNLLIVIMQDATQQVRGSAHRVAVSEKTKLLLDIDHTWLPIFIALGWNSLADSENFPKWIHVLTPVLDVSSSASNAGSENCSG